MWRCCWVVNSPDGPRKYVFHLISHNESSDLMTDRCAFRRAAGTNSTSQSPASVRLTTLPVSGFGFPARTNRAATPLRISLRLLSKSELLFEVVMRLGRHWLV